jgi:transposase
MERKPYPSGVSDDWWGFIIPYLNLMSEDAPQRIGRLRKVFNGWLWLARAGLPWQLMPKNLPLWEATSKQTQRWMAAGLCDAIGHDWRLIVRLAAGATTHPLVDRGYGDAQPAQDAAAPVIQLAVLKRLEAKKDFVQSPRCWMSEGSVGWAARFRRLARDDERLPAPLAGVHCLVCVLLSRTRFVTLMMQSA